MAQSNPFVFEQFAMGDAFCGRLNELSTLSERSENCKNTLLISPRRIGKSSLVNEFFNHAKLNGFLCVYVDLFEILSAEDFARLLYQASAEAIPWNVKKFMSQAGRIFRKVTFEASPSSNGESMKFRPALAPRNFEEYLQDALEGLQSYAENHSMKVVVAFDEFQQITLIKDTRIDAILRKFMQQSKNMSFIFLGSKRHMLQELFNGQSQPLYKMASLLNLEGIKESDFHEFAQTKMKVNFPIDVFNHLYKETSGESKLIQHICYHIFNNINQKDTISFRDINTAIVRILNEEDGLYRSLFDENSINNKKALKSVVEQHGIGLFSTKLLSSVKLSKASMQKSLTNLRKDEIIDKVNERWIILDRTYHLWIKSLYS